MKRNPTNRPFVFVNMAVTADGKIATANRAVSSFGSQQDLDHLYKLRTTAHAIMAGARTLDLNKVLLANGGERYRRMRLRRGLGEYPLRVIVSGSGTINPQAAIFQKHFSPILLITSRRASAETIRTLRPLVDDLFISPDRTIDFAAALRWLAEKWQVHRLLCEGGGELNAALFRERLVDELNLTICPKIFGGRHAPTIADGDWHPPLANATNLRIHSFRQVGQEVFLKFRCTKK
jgi:riboflavin-specific deaminase-like protein